MDILRNPHFNINSILLKMIRQTIFISDLNDRVSTFVHMSRNYRHEAEKTSERN